MIGRFIENLYCWVMIALVCLLVLAVMLALLGGICWSAVSIWKIVFWIFNA